MSELAPEVEALATALGLFSQGALDPQFFANPLQKLTGIIKTAEQRAALLDALDDLLPPGDAPTTNADGDTTTRHPIVTTAVGSLAITIVRSGPFDLPNAVVGLSGEARHAASGVRLVADFPLVEGSSSDLHVVAGSPEHPLAVGIDVPVGWQRSSDVIGLESVSLSALVLAPPNEADSRIAVRLAGLDVGLGTAADVLLDPADLGTELAHTLSMLLLAGLHRAEAAADNAADDALTRLAAQLPTVLGLDGELPPLPLGDLIHDPSAFAGWLSALTETVVDGEPALVRWLDAVGQLLGAAETTMPELPGTTDPLTLTLFDGSPTGATVELTAWLETPAASTVRELHLGIDVHVAGSVALIAGRAELLVVPLGGNDPVRPLPSAEIVVESVSALLPGAGGPLTIGTGRAGLRWTGSQIVPVLELDGVHVELPGVVQAPTDFARLDLTNARTLAAQARGVIGQYLDAQLGSTGSAPTVFALIGLDLPPTDAQLGAFANDPLRAIGAFHREALDAGTYRAVASSIASLFGVATAVTGTGTIADPWLAPLSDVPVPAGSPLTLQLRIWDEPTGTDHDLHIGLAATSPAGTRPTFGFALTLDLVTFALPAAAPVRAGLIGEARVELDLYPPQAPGPLGVPGSVQVDHLSLGLGWQPGSPVTADLAVHDLVVDVDGTDVTIPVLSLPDGLTADVANGAWAAVRQLLAGAARSWGGPLVANLADLLGLDLSAPQLPGTWPLLELPAGGVGDLLADPAALLRGRLAGLVAAGPDPDGLLPVEVALDRVRDLLNQSSPLRTGPPGLPSAPAVVGGGSYDDPWRIPLTDPATPLVDQPVDLLGWVEPGAPASWSAAAAALLDLADTDTANPGLGEPDLVGALGGLLGTLHQVATGLAGLDPDTASGWLTSVADAVDGTDGLVPSDIGSSLPQGAFAPIAVTAAHHLAPQAADAVTAALAHLSAHGATAVPLLLLAPGFAPADVWSGFLTGVDPAQLLAFTLDRPGIQPDLVDLGTLTAATHYVFDLADDGTADLAQLSTRLGRLVQRVLAVTGATKVALVAHSIAALPAVQYAAANAGSVQACVTIAAPYATGPSSLFDGAEEAAGLRLALTLLPAAPTGATALRATLDQLGRLLDGFDGANARPFPTAAFARVLPSTLDLTAVPTLPITAQLEAPLGVALAAALGAAAGATPDVTPTHLAWALATEIRNGTDGSTDTPQVELTVRLDLGRVALSAGAPEPAHPAHRLAVEALIHQPGGWLVGGPGSGTPLDVRVRGARLSFTHTAADSSFAVQLYDAAVQGSGASVLDLSDARSARLLAAVMDTLASQAEDGSSVRALLDLLAALELITFDPTSDVAAVRADAMAAIKTDPAGWLQTRAQQVLQSAPALFGLAPLPTSAGSPRRWTRALGDLPIQLEVADGPWSLGLATTGSGLDLGGTSRLALSGLLGLSGQAVIEAALTVPGLSLSYADETLSLAASPALSPIAILPPAPDVADRLLAALSTTGLAAAATAAIESALGGLVPVGSLVGLLRSPSQWLSDVGRFAAPAGSHPGAAGPGLDPAAVTTLLSCLATALTLPMEAQGLKLADGLHLSAGGSGGGLRLGLDAEQLALSPGGPSLDATLSLDVGAAASGWTASPGGTVSVTLPLGGTWPSLSVIVGLDAGGFSLAVQPGGQPAISLMPHFAGLWDLLGGGVEALLPGVLDGLLDRLGPVTPGSLLDTVLAVADSLGLRPSAPAFDSAALATLVDRITAGTLVPAPATLVAVANTLLPAGAPVTVGTSGSAVTVTVTELPVPGTAVLAADIAGGGVPPIISLALSDVRLGPIMLDLSVQDDSGALGLSAAATVDVSTDLGFDFAPTLQVSAAPLTIAVFPAGTSVPLSIDLAPTPGISPAPSAIAQLVIAWIAPIAAKAGLEATNDLLETPLWQPPSGTPLTPLMLLRAARLVDQTQLRLIHPLPDAAQIVRGLLAGLDVFRIPVTPDLSVGVYADGPSWLGLGLTGQIDLHPGDFTVSLLIGDQPVPGWSDPPAGLGVLLLDDSAGLQPRPGLRLGAVGVQLAKNGGPLVDTSVLRISDVAALVQVAVDLTGAGLSVTGLHGGVRIGQIGLPVGQSGSTENPVASSLLKSDGSSGPGDDRPASPPTDLEVISNDSGTLQVTINGKSADQPFYVDIHKVFGPLHIDRIGLQHLSLGSNSDAVGALVDGGVSIAGLVVEVQGLEITVPLQHAAELNRWSVDLSGLAVAFSAGPVSIAGGLLKQNLASGVEYDGMLTVQVASFGITALGAYAKASSGTDTYTSLFVFIVIKAPIGGPPFLFVTGLAGGAGYNRQLIVPTDPAVIANFPLVTALKDGAGTDPMGTLHQMSNAMPARRGSYWVAAGVTFTTFELIDSLALAYVALDRGFEVGLIGLMTMALPDADDALVSIELALLARYSTVDQLLAVRAQLTNNSWLISRDCQLTGGFAFYNWFGDNPQTLLTIGGMGPNWRIEPGDTHPYPTVPPVGFHWSVGGGIVVKGESYFALTPRQLAFGGRLEATYDVDPIRVWFTVYLDVDIEWKPLHYHLDAGISIGAQFHFTIDLLFGSITISVSVSLGGSVVIDGPPLHGSVTVELEIASVTVDFGRDTDPPLQSWAQFAAGFLAITGAPSTDPDESGGQTSVATVSYGQYANSRQGPQNAGPMPDGSPGSPWPVRPEFGLDVLAKLPLASAGFPGQQLPRAGDATPTDLQRLPFSIKPMGSSGGSYSAHLEITLSAHGAGSWSPVDVSRVTATASYGHFPVAIWVAAGIDPPGEHPDLWLTVSGASLAFPVDITESSGALGDNAQIPISTLVEESATVLPLPFTAPAGLLRPALPVPEPRKVRSTSGPRTATLVAALDARGIRASATRPLGTANQAAFAAIGAAVDRSDVDSFVTVGLGETHVWTPPAHAEFNGRGSGRIRVTSLSPTGYVLDDQEGVAADLQFGLHAESHRVVVTGLDAAGGGGTSTGSRHTAGGTDRVLGGWQAGTLLTQVADDTLLGPGCAVLLPWPVSAARPRALERRVAARDVLDLVPGQQTLLPVDTGVVIVLLDALQAAALQSDEGDDLVVSLGLADGNDPGRLGRPVEVLDGTRRCLVYPVERPAETRLAVAVASARSWRVAGVLGATGRPREWIDRLRAEPHAELAGRPGPGTGADYRIVQTVEVPA